MAARGRVVHPCHSRRVHQHIALNGFEEGHIIGKQPDLVGDGSLGLQVLELSMQTLQRFQQELVIKLLLQNLVVTLL